MPHPSSRESFLREMLPSINPRRESESSVYVILNVVHAQKFETRRDQEWYVMRGYIYA